MINKKISSDGKNNINAKMNSVPEELTEKMKQYTLNQERKALRETEKDKKLSFNFTVAVRVKPKIGDIDKINNSNLLSYSDVNNETLILEYPQNKKQSYTYCSKNRKFTFDSIFIDRDNRTIYDDLIKSKLAVLKQNMNLTLLTYGITGSGKTHTIFGNKEMKESGLAMMVFEDVIRSYSLRSQARELSTQNNDKKTQFMFSYMQIYNEQVHDLLQCQKNTKTENLQDRQSIPQLKLKSLCVFQDSSGKVVIPQLAKINVDSIEMIQELVDKGNSIRACSSNLINKLSSRSHAILQLYCIQKQTKIQNIVTIIDLAGSERHITTNLIHGLSKEKENQNLQKQGSNINRSLLALGNCLKGLQNGQTHIPYRDSKLTRILKEDLSGKSHNIMIACVGRNLSQADQTINTLQYASRAVNIKVEKVRNIAKNVALECIHCYKFIPWGHILQKLPQQFCASRKEKQNNKENNWDECQRENEMKKMLKQIPQELTPNIYKKLQLNISQLMEKIKKDIWYLVNNKKCDKDISPLFKYDAADFQNQFSIEGQCKQMISDGITEILDKYQMKMKKKLVQICKQIQVKSKEVFNERDKKTKRLQNGFCSLQIYEKIKIENQIEEKSRLESMIQKNIQRVNYEEHKIKTLRDSQSSISFQDYQQKGGKNKNKINLDEKCDFVEEYRQYNNKIRKKVNIKNMNEGFWKGSSASTMNSNNCVNSSYDDVSTNNNYRNRVKTQRMNPDIDVEPDSECNGSKSLIIKKLKQAKKDTLINEVERMHQNCSRIQFQIENRRKTKYAEDSFVYINKRQRKIPNQNYSEINKNHKSILEDFIKIRHYQMEEEVQVSSFREDSSHPQTLNKQVETFI